MNRLSHSLASLHLLVAATFVSVLGVSALNTTPVAAAGSASFSLSPEKANASGADTLDVAVFVDSGDVSINAVEPQLQFDPTLLQVKNIEGAGSAFDVAAPVSNENGSLRLPRGKATPGVTGRQKVATVSFRVVGAAQSASITFGDNSAILTLDGAADIWNRKTTGGIYALNQPAERSDVPVTGTKSYPVAVIVQDKQGVSIQGATVTLGDGRTATTDAKGVAGFLNVPEGQYDATVSKGGKTERRSVAVEKGGENDVQEHAFTLTAGGAKSVSLPYGFIALLVLVVAAAVFAAWRWHKRIVAHHLTKQGAASPEKK